jgi:hypothetical protein
MSDGRDMQLDPDPETTAGELAAWRDLLQSEGWRLLMAYGAKAWGPEGYGWQMQQALANVPSGPDRPYEIARVAEQVDATAKAVNSIFSYPAERIAALTAGSRLEKQPFWKHRRMGR